MELIQNSLHVREGKKWKQRWGVLKQVSPDKSIRDSACYLFMYKDGSHAKEGKEKNVISLVNFCGVDMMNEFEKGENILILITLSQTIYLSFESLALRERWLKVLLDQFGQSVSYNISIPDKQKLKAGQATIRLYPSFFSIINCKNFKCLNRWSTKDIYQYYAVDSSHFLFELASSKSRGQVVNLLVPDNAHEIAQAFDYNTSASQSVNTNNDLQHNDFHGSAMLDELNQAKRHAGDQNFFTRAFLRASNRMKKRKKERYNVFLKKKGTPTDSEESRFQSLDRRKSPDLSVNLDATSFLKTIQMVDNHHNRSKSTSACSNHSTDVPPILPTKKHNSKNSLASNQSASEIDGERKLRSMTADISYMNHQSPSSIQEKDRNFKSAEDIPHRDKKLQTSENTVKEDVELKQKLTVPDVTDKSDIPSSRQQKRSIDSALTTNYSNKPPLSVIENPAKYAIEKTRRGSNKSKSVSYKTPTPPPRSPVSLGFQPTDGCIIETSKFQFPSVEKICDNEDEEISSKRMNESNSDDLSDDAFIVSTNGVVTSPDSLNNNAPIYNNVTVHACDDNNSNNKYLNTDSYAIRRAANRRKTQTKHLSDPLSCENWAEATGDGKVLLSMPQIPPTDYINLKGAPQSDDDNDSYVNVTGQLNVKQKKKPVPLRLMSYRNEFEKYDDEDSSIYHAVGALDKDGNSHSSDSIIYRNQSNGSYENMNATGPTNSHTRSEYLNLMSPPKTKQKLNYVMVGKMDTSPGMYGTSKSTSASPVRRNQQRSPSETYNKSDYTRIDESATGALSRSMQEHRQARDKYQTTKQQSKTPK